MLALPLPYQWKQPGHFLLRRWPWHLSFWTGYILFRFWAYYITIRYYAGIFLEYMLLSEVVFVGMTYLTLWFYRRWFVRKKYGIYFLTGTASWILFLTGRTLFQFAYLEGEPAFRNNSFTDIFVNNITVVIVFFLFITSCKYFKDGYISQQQEAEKRQQQLVAEVNNLKSQIAPHFLFNTLNNLYGLAVEKSDKLPDLMLRLSDLLRHSLYETQKPLVSLKEEIHVLNSYINLETLRLEKDLKLEFEDQVPEDVPFLIAPLILIVFVENAFKHARFVQSEPVAISIKTAVDEDWFSLTIRNNYNRDREDSTTGIGLSNVKRRLNVLYPDRQHQLTIIRDERFFTVYLHLQLKRA